MYSCVFAISLSFILAAAPLFAATEGNRCREEGIMVRNATTIDLWYKKNDGECFIWIHEHLFNITTEDNINLFSGPNCQKLYCANNPTYKDYKSSDANGNCRVRILPKCTLSDM
jgi:hypothetical protein